MGEVDINVESESSRKTVKSGESGKFGYEAELICKKAKQKNIVSKLTELGTLNIS